MNIQSSYVLTIFRLLGVIVIGVVIGSLLSKLLTIVSLPSWVFNQVRQFWSLFSPALLFGWFCCLVSGGMLITRSETRSFAIYWLTVTVGTWLCFTVVVAAIQLSYGKAYTTIGEIIIGSAYLAAASSFGYILSPLLIARLLRFGLDRLVRNLAQT